MDDDALREAPDLVLKKIGKQDISAMSVGDLKERIEALRGEIERCEQAIAARDTTRSAAEKLFKL